MRVLKGLIVLKQVKAKRTESMKKRKLSEAIIFFLLSFLPRFPYGTARKYSLFFVNKTDVKSCEQYFLTSMDSLDFAPEKQSLSSEIRLKPSKYKRRSCHGSHVVNDFFISLRLVLFLCFSCCFVCCF